MTPDKLQFLSTMTTRQKVTAGVFALIVVVIIWQVVELFSGGGGTAKVAPAPAPSPVAMNKGAPTMAPTGPAAAAPQSPIQTPQPAQFPKQTAQSEREMALIKLQQETEAKYISALNELQMLKIEREIAENNKAIMSAKLDTVTAEKNIVDLLTKPTPQVPQGAYAQGLVSPFPSGGALPTQPVPSGAPSAAPIQPMPPQEVNYTVISVSQLQYRWSAVLGYQGSLYNVSVGDFLPPDRSKVIAINKSGVELEKNGVKKKISLVPII